MNTIEIFHSPSREHSILNSSKGLMRSYWGESFRELSRRVVKDFRGRKVLKNKEISLSSINPSRIHAHVRAMGAFTCTRACEGLVNDFRERSSAASPSLDLDTGVNSRSEGNPKPNVADLNRRDVKS